MPADIGRWRTSLETEPDPTPFGVTLTERAVYADERS
jgi:hypothetical protein